MMTLNAEDEAMLSSFPQSFEQIWAGIIVAESCLRDARDRQLGEDITPRRFWLHSLALLISSLPASNADDVLYKLGALGLTKEHEDLMPSNAASLIEVAIGIDLGTLDLDLEELMAGQLH